MRSFLQLLSLAAGLSQATATPVLSRAAGAAKNLVVFGDSYSTVGFWPGGDLPSPGSPLGNPALPGQTTANGLNWVGQLTSVLNTSSVLTYDFAVTGATVDKEIVSTYAQYCVDDQVAQYREYVANKISSAETLVAVWIGINDLGEPFWKKSAAPIEKTMDRYFELLKMLSEAGLKKFALLTVPPFADQIPAMIGQSESDLKTLRADIIAYNKALTERAATFSKSGSGIEVTVFDTKPTFDTAVKNFKEYGAKDATCYGANECLWTDTYHAGVAIHKALATNFAEGSSQHVKCPSRSNHDMQFYPSPIVITVDIMADSISTADPVALEVDEADTNTASDTDSLGSIEGSSTSSITSSILKYRQENGRTYHAYKDGQYVIPNDEQEQDRLDLQHHLFLLTFDHKLYLSPAGREGRQLHNVLDVGTGTGLWAMDFADEHPSASVIGIDLSPIQSPFVPPNLSFQVDDIEEPWTFHVKFDFIYSRMMTASIADWPGFFAKAYDNLNPGGWIELADIYPITSDDGTLAKDSATHEWVTRLLDGTKMIGRPFDGANKYKEQLEAQGFQNVQQVVFKWPQNTWPRYKKHKELGAWNLENISSGLEGLSSAVYTRVLGWTKEELDVLLAKVRREMKDRTIHSYWPIYVVYGQKPEK
ncbi:hypothetical protein CEK27_007767 [Fusarium fujikuroi]|nr:hypothetical protein CEK27_007767 [Fusarium fujikuroi]